MAEPVIRSVWVSLRKGHQKTWHRPFALLELIKGKESKWDNRPQKHPKSSKVELLFFKYIYIFSFFKFIFIFTYIYIYNLCILAFVYYLNKSNKASLVYFDRLTFNYPRILTILNVIPMYVSFFHFFLYFLSLWEPTIQMSLLLGMWHPFLFQSKQIKGSILDTGNWHKHMVMQKDK